MNQWTGAALPAVPTAFEAAHLQRYDFHGDWHHTVRAATCENATRPNQQNNFCVSPQARTRRRLPLRELGPNRY